MTQDLNLSDEQYICEECGNTSPVANDHCSNCGAPMSALHDEKPKAKVLAGESEDDLSDETVSESEDGSTSLEALADEEEKESQAEYNADTFGDE